MGILGHMGANMLAYWQDSTVTRAYCYSIVLSLPVGRPPSIIVYIPYMGGAGALEH